MNEPTPAVPVDTPPDAVALVLADLAARRELGRARYGKTVSPDDPAEDWLRHAYEEALDLCVYLRAELARRANRG